MAVALEFINLLVRVDAIRSKYLGGWHQFLKDHEQAIGSTGWYDDNLYREGAMSPTDIGHLVVEQLTCRDSRLADERAIAKSW